jgi:hypothetical protein
LLCYGEALTGTGLRPSTVGEQKEKRPLACLMQGASLPPTTPPATPPTKKDSSKLDSELHQSFNTTQFQIKQTTPLSASLLVREYRTLGIVLLSNHSRHIPGASQCRPLTAKTYLSVLAWHKCANLLQWVPLERCMVSSSCVYQYKLTHPFCAARPTFPLSFPRLSAQMRLLTIWGSRTSEPAT